MSITKSCNWERFSSSQVSSQVLFDYDTSIHIILILNAVLLLFFLVKMCKLCSYAFSYSNYHIHETYKLYTFAVINVTATIMVILQNIKLHNFLYPNGQKKDFPDGDSNLLGYYIINDLIIIVGVFTNSFLIVFNDFTWLAIAKNCDFTMTDDSQLINSEQMDNSSQQESFIKVNIKQVRKKIQYTKIFFIYFFLPILLILSLFGTLKHREGDDWCKVVSISMIVSVYIPNLLFCIAFGLYLKKFSEPEVSMKTKIGLVFLLLAVIARSIYYLIFFFVGGKNPSWGSVTNMLYGIVFSLLPMLVMTLLSEVQLYREQFNIMRRSNELIFRSTVI